MLVKIDFFLALGDKVWRNLQLHSYSKLITFNFNVSSKVCQRFVRRGAEQKPFPWGDVTFIFSRFCFVHLSNLSLFSMGCLFQDIPQQMNGSDCGMFACKFAEYITREADINFSQVNPAHKVKRFVVNTSICCQ